MKRQYSGIIERNLIHVFNQATESELNAGLSWYKAANETAVSMARECGISADAAIGIIAALSPGCEWGKNLQYARTLIEALNAGKPAPLVGTYGWSNVRKAERIYRGEKPLDVLGGFKVRSFYRNISDPENRDGGITVDRHAYCAAVNRRNRRDPKFTRIKGEYFPHIDKPAMYNWIARHYQTVAAKLGLFAHQVQAVIWLVWKRLVGSTANAAA